jgi:hypothetical protein
VDARGDGGLHLHGPVDPVRGGAGVTVVAHAGHWIEGVIFAAPVLIVAAALGISALREKRRRKRS